MEGTRKQESGGFKKTKEGFQSFAKAVRDGMEKWNRNLRKFDQDNRRKRDHSNFRRQDPKTKSKNHTLALKKKESELKKALELQRDIRRIESERVGLEERLGEVRKRATRAEAAAEALRAAGASRALMSEAAHEARDANHRIDLIYDDLRELHSRARNKRRNSNFMRPEEITRTFEEVLAYRRTLNEEEDDYFESDFAAKCCFCAIIVLSEEARFCEECSSSTCQVCIDRFGARCLNCHGRNYGAKTQTIQRRGRNRQRNNNSNGNIYSKQRPKSYGGTADWREGRSVNFREPDYHNLPPPTPLPRGRPPPPPPPPISQQPTSMSRGVTGHHAQYHVIQSSDQFPLEYDDDNDPLYECIT